VNANDACAFCGKGAAEVERLAVTPNAAICDGCLRLCSAIVAGRVTSPGTEADLVCAFCGKDRRGILVAGPSSYICGECVSRLSESN
jgi:ATP-dependent protease Clp ATPase subunit